VNIHPVGQYEAGLYEIRLQGRLDDRWATWFDGMTLTTTTDTDGVVRTVVRGHVADQAALHGLLARLRDIGLPLISITRTEPDPTGGDRAAGDRCR
jgi:hypothetical protein